MRFPTVVDAKTVTEHADDDMVAIMRGRVILQPTPQQIDQYQRLASRESVHLRELGVFTSAAPLAPMVTALKWPPTSLCRADERTGHQRPRGSVSS
ncbi:hypothetical protein ACW185_10670 [Limosilactobacillus fermentum]